jgi:uncharacterized protein (DUF4415 family)
MPKRKTPTSKNVPMTMKDVAHLPLLKDAQPEVYQAFAAWQQDRRRGRPPKIDSQIAISAKIDPDILAAIKERGLVRNRFINETLRAALFDQSISTTTGV